MAGPKYLAQRLRAAAIHLSLSAIAFGGALALFLVSWFPGYHFGVDGGWQGTRIMAAVDLVLGPLLTLIVFNPAKARKLIVFDLTCIGLAQVAALMWGFYAIHSQRTVAVSWQDGRFHGVSAEPLKVEKYDVDELKKLSDVHPALVYVAPPENEDEKTRVAMQAVVGGTLEYEDPFFFRPFAEHWPDVRKAGRSLEKQRAVNAAVASEYESGGNPADALFFDYSGRYGECTLAFTADGRLLGAWGCVAS